MRRTATVLATLALSALCAAPSLAQPAARLYGYEKAPWVSGTVTLSAERGEVAVTGFSSTYREPLTLYAARGFDRRGAVRVGEIPAGFAGDTSFPLPSGAAGCDTVILLTPADSGVPVGLGLVR